MSDLLCAVSLLGCGTLASAAFIVWCALKLGSEREDELIAARREEAERLKAERSAADFLKYCGKVPQ